LNVLNNEFGGSRQAGHYYRLGIIYRKLDDLEKSYNFMYESLKERCMSALNINTNLNYFLEPEWSKLEEIAEQGNARIKDIHKKRHNLKYLTKKINNKHKIKE